MRIGVEYHAYPLADTIRHETDDGDCICGPTTEVKFREDGSSYFTIRHHPLGGEQ